jgi:hypothetical protein
VKAIDQIAFRNRVGTKWIADSYLVAEVSFLKKGLWREGMFKINARASTISGEWGFVFGVRGPSQIRQRVSMVI